MTTTTRPILAPSQATHLIRGLFRMACDKVKQGNATTQSIDKDISDIKRVHFHDDGDSMCLDLMVARGAQVSAIARLERIRKAIKEMKKAD